MPARYKNIVLAALVIFFGFGMSELMRILAAEYHLNHHPQPSSSPSSLVC